MIGIWMTLGIWFNQPCVWMAPFSVIDLSLILRFTGLGPGWRRFTAVLIGTVVIGVASQWLIAANAFGLVMGLLPLESVHMVGRVLVGEFTRLRMVSSDWLWLLISFTMTLWLHFRPGHPAS